MELPPLLVPLDAAPSVDVNLANINQFFFLLIVLYNFADIQYYWWWNLNIIFIITITITITMILSRFADIQPKWLWNPNTRLMERFDIFSLWVLSDQTRNKDVWGTLACFVIWSMLCELWELLLVALILLVVIDQECDVEHTPFQK